MTAPLNAASNNSARALVLDAGNTQLKFGVWQAGALARHGLLPYDAHLPAALDELMAAHAITHVAYCSVLTEAHPLAQYLRQAGTRLQVHVFNAFSAAPVANQYQTPHTLGPDRFAAVAGARGFTPTGALLVLDAGTALTYDFVNHHNQYLGGGIAPGLRMRYQALHHYTAKLPLLEPLDADVPLVGSSTESSLRSGVQNGMAAEMQGIIDRYVALNGQATEQKLTIYLTGGDTLFFEKRLKNVNFANPNLVLYGIGQLLNIKLLG
jgi:type III pantothenate kinase